MSIAQLVVFGVVFAAIGAFALHTAYRLAFPKKSVQQDAKGQDDPAVCKETCDIVDRSGEMIQYACGHEDAEEYRVDMYGEPMLRKMKEKEPKYCAECLLAEVKKVTVRCGACGFAIKPGDPVALCVDDKRIGKKEWKTYIGNDLLVCLRWECDNGPGYCGHWMGNGIKPAFPDGGTHISQVFKTGEPLFTQIGPLDGSEPPKE